VKKGFIKGHNELVGWEQIEDGIIIASSKHGNKLKTGRHTLHLPPKLAANRNSLT